MIRSRSFMTQEVRLISWKEATSLGDFPAFSDVMMFSRSMDNLQGGMMH